MKNNVRKDLILKVAKERFARYGFKKTTMDEIAADLRMGKPTLYYYYQTKEQIYEAVLKFEIDEFNKSLKEILENKNLNLYEKFNHFFQARKKTFSDNYNLYYLQLEAVSLMHILDEKSLYFELVKKEVEFFKSLLSEYYSKSKSKEAEINKISEYLSTFVRGILFIARVDSRNDEQTIPLDFKEAEESWNFLIEKLFPED